MTPTRASVLAATGEELDRLVLEHVYGWSELSIAEAINEKSTKAYGCDDPAEVIDEIKVRDLGPAFARELARIVCDLEFPIDAINDVWADAGDLWDILSAPPEAVCRAAVLACLGEG